MKLRDKALIYLPDETTVKRNVYSYYISNTNPIYIRYKGHVHLVFPHKDGFKLGRLIA